MSQLFRSCLTVAAILSIVSCSTLRKIGRSNSVDVAENIADTISMPTIDSATLQKDRDDIEAMISADSIDRSMLVLDPDILESDEDIYPVFHFEGDQTSSTVISEYRGLVVEDIKINLAEEHSHYPADGYVTSKYGWRGRRMHAGIDLKAYKGDNLYAAFDGVVRLAKYHGSYGNCVIIRHYNGLETIYGHATKLLVEVNDVVKAGDVIAYAGSTGRSTGSHLHFETRVAGHYFNPTLILDTDNRKIKDANLYITMRNGRLFASNNDSEEEREAYILQQISIRYYTVRSGDTLGGIAAKNGTTVTTLCRLNGISSRSILRIGQRLIVKDGIVIPKKGTTTSTAASSTPNSSTSSSAPAAAQSTTIHTVKRGDTLGAIAKRYGTTVSKICSLNGISSRSTLRIGQRLKISGAAATTSSSQSAQYHTVKSGDTLGGIAQKYGTTISKLCSLNGISRNSILNLKQKIRVR